MKTYSYMVLAILFSFLLSLNSIKLVSLDETSLFLTVIGLIYGLIAAFTINNAWERFSAIRDGISEEVYALISVYTYTKELSDKSSFRKFKEKLLDYCKDVPTIEWVDYWNSEPTHRKFRDLIRIIAQVKIKNIKDELLFNEITTELGNAARVRIRQIVLSQTRISGIQWMLNIFLSSILVLGLIFTSFPDYWLSVFIISTMVAAILMIFIVLYELDSMKLKKEDVSNEPHRQVIRIIESE